MEFKKDEYGRLDMISRGRLEKSIKKQLEDLVNDLFYKYQTELGIDNGDIGIDNEIELDCAIEDMTRVIADSLDYQLEWMAEAEED